MNNHSFFKQILFVLFISFFISCDSDSNEIGTNIVGDDNFLLEKQDFSVVAHTETYGITESTNLPVNLLGVYDNPVFGKTTANFATQVQLAAVNPTIDPDLNPTIIDVTLSVPYYSKVTGTSTAGDTTYSLDSIFGKKDAKLNLKVYRSRTYMSAVETKFYNNSNAIFQDLVTENDLLGKITDFTFSPNFVVEETYDENTNQPVKTSVAPRLNMVLTSEKFTELFTTAAANGSLLNNTIFKEYFRGLYFKVEQADASQGVMALLNFAGGKITIRYKQQVTKGNTENTVNKSMVLNMIGNTVSLTDNTPTAAISDIDQKLILQGGAGKMAIIELFPDAAELAALKKRKLLVNDASLTFFVDAETMAMTNGTDKAIEPERIYLYDITTNTPIIDYYSDQSVNSTYTNLSKSTYGGIIEKKLVNNTTTEKRGFQYKIKLTNHVMRLLADGDTYKNVKLGLVVTKNINLVNTSTIKNSITLLPNNEVISVIPSMSVVSPAATILWGSGENVPEDKRLKLQVYYTKPN